uniref:probable thiopurine S-methyltransferase isoform X1 n=1 Tax=Styela clava TaxID=7725 RepID=UPI00193AB0E8|nr:probable thiopurine S-methyltransferase isoform X1 [Styela clava]XP_039272164.1 probable thiopurine S-methyltransferase isoform X2 [Styela clava]
MSESKEMQKGELAPTEWIWNEDKNPPFHRTQYAPMLVKHFDCLFADGETGRVFVPLCGKTLDMIFLADKGLEVVGLEFSEIGVEGFFKDNNLTYKKMDVVNQPLVQYKCNEKNITIYRGDMFNLNPDVCGQFDGIWDRGSYVAINIPTQQKYADLILQLMKPKAKILMETFTYDTSRYGGPPHCITLENLQSTFGSKCQIKVVDTMTMLAHPVFNAGDMIMTLPYCLLSMK